MEDKAKCVWMRSRKMVKENVRVRSSRLMWLWQILLENNDIKYIENLIEVRVDQGKIGPFNKIFIWTLGTIKRLLAPVLSR